MYTIVTLGILFMAISSYAGPAWEFTSAGNSFTNGTWDFAATFTVNENETVTATGL
jgi:hypothetical protein